MANETELKQVIDTWDAAWQSKNAEAMKDCFSPDVTLHADGMLLGEDISGSDKVLENFSKYFSMYDFKHSCLATAVNPDKNSAFGCWEDVDSTGDGKDSVRGIWKVKVTGGKISEIYFLRQMHQNEKERKLQDASSIKGDQIQLCSPTPDMSAASPDFSNTMRKAAEHFSDLWQTGNVEIADEVCKSDFHSVDVFKGGETSSKDDFKSMLKETFKHWGSETHDLDIAVTPNDNKAFVHWKATGHVEGRERPVTTFGLNLLEFDPKDGKIMRSAGFRQMMPNEAKEMLKPEAYAQYAEL